MLQLLARGVDHHGAFQTAGWAPIFSTLSRKLGLCIAPGFAGTELGAGAVRAWVRRLMVWMVQRSGLSLTSLGTSLSEPVNRVTSTVAFIYIWANSAKHSKPALCTCLWGRCWKLSAPIKLMLCIGMGKPLVHFSLPQAQDNRKYISSGLQKYGGFSCCAYGLGPGHAPQLAVVDECTSLPALHLGFHWERNPAPVGRPRHHTWFNRDQDYKRPAGTCLPYSHRGHSRRLQLTGMFTVLSSPAFVPTCDQHAVPQSWSYR